MPLGKREGSGLEPEKVKRKELFGDDEEKHSDKEWELDLMILMDPFQLRTPYGSLNLSPFILDLPCFDRSYSGGLANTLCPLAELGILALTLYSVMMKDTFGLTTTENLRQVSAPSSVHEIKTPLHISRISHWGLDQSMSQQCPGSQESQLCPGVHQTQHHQPGKRGDCPTLLCFGTASP
ncbi:hypothetical protein TURU_093106 [Turdus rufiventris]|nr:hypothetical protein TURU_093106 [Turdus rufiventris]